MKSLPFTDFPRTKSAPLLVGPVGKSSPTSNHNLRAKDGHLIVGMEFPGKHRKMGGFSIHFWVSFLDYFSQLQGVTQVSKNFWAHSVGWNFFPTDGVSLASFNQLLKLMVWVGALGLKKRVPLMRGSGPESKPLDPKPSTIS